MMNLQNTSRLGIIEMSHNFSNTYFSSFGISFCTFFLGYDSSFFLIFSSVHRFILLFSDRRIKARSRRHVALRHTGLHPHVGQFRRRSITDRGNSLRSSSSVSRPPPVGLTNAHRLERYSATLSFPTINKPHTITDNLEMKNPFKSA